MSQTQSPTILIVGNLLAGKGHELVLKAIGKLTSLFPDLQCGIIGEGADRERFARLAADLGITDQIHFLGRRSRADVAKAMQGCTLFRFAQPLRRSRLCLPGGDGER